MPDGIEVLRNDSAAVSRRSHTRQATLDQLATFCPRWERDVT